MTVVYILVGLSILFAAGFLAAFLWAVRTGQFDDKDTPPMRILFEDHPPGPNSSSSSQN